jgi:hypothetical protein
VRCPQAHCLRLRPRRRCPTSPSMERAVHGDSGSSLTGCRRSVQNTRETPSLDELGRVDSSLSMRRRARRF